MWKWITGFLVVVVVAVGGWFYWQQVLGPQRLAAAQPAFVLHTVERGPISATVSATGSIEPASQVSLQFRASGRVTKVLVTEGQAVQSGQLLAELDTTDPALAVAQAQVNLQIAEAQLAKLETPPDENDILAAQAAVEVAQASVAGAEAGLAAAQANHGQLFAQTSAAQLQVNEANLRQAEINLRSAQQQYNAVASLPNIGELPQAAQLESATAAWEVAQAQATLTESNPNNAQVASGLNQIAQAELGIRQAQANLIQAQNNLATLLEGPSAQDLEISGAQVQQARISLLSAESNLANAQLVAPINGVVSVVNVREGELYSGALPAVVISNLDSFHMDVLVDEIDVRQIAVGQPVVIRVDAFGDDHLIGSVTQIAPTAQNVGGVIAYGVTVVPDPTDLPLRAGMSATAIITTADVPDAILAPNRFVGLNRDTGTAFVYRMIGGAPVQQAVELGLRNERESQIVAGLNEGDQIALVTASSTEQLRNVFMGN